MIGVYCESVVCDPHNKHLSQFTHYLYLPAYRLQQMLKIAW